MRPIVPAIVLIALTSSAHLHADDRPDHFEGKASETLEQAYTNFAATNQKVADILAKTELSATEMAEIHELTYTIENALQRIDAEYTQLAAQLEALHLASEGTDTARAQTLGTTYLNNANRFQN